MALQCFLLAVACLAGQALGQDYMDSEGRPRAMTTVQTTSIMDGNNEQVAMMNLTFSVWGDYNPIADRLLVMSFVLDKLPLLRSMSEDSAPEMFEMDGSLPLQSNVTAKEVITVGPNSRSMSLWMNLQMYGKTREHSQNMTMYSVGPSSAMER